MVEITSERCGTHRKVWSSSPAFRARHGPPLGSTLGRGDGDRAQNENGGMQAPLGIGSQTTV